jgi:hypothetical protein
MCEFKRIRRRSLCGENGATGVISEGAKEFDIIAFSVIDSPQLPGDDCCASGVLEFDCIPRRGLRVFSDFEFEFRMGLANKKLAPDVETVAVMADERHIHISSSTIREVAELGGDVSSMVPPFVAEALRERFAELQENGNSPGYMISIRE